MASAIASISVDFPVPLSPASSVTGASSRIFSTAATAGDVERKSLAPVLLLPL